MPVTLLLWRKSSRQQLTQAYWCLLGNGSNHGKKQGKSIVIWILKTDIGLSSVFILIVVEFVRWRLHIGIE